jgi:ABC-type transporter Mla subunit MlaD
MVQEVNLNPIPTGMSSASARNRVMVSDTTIAEQFCMVAADMRSLLQSMKTSVDLQRQMVEAFETHSLKLDNALASIGNATSVLEDMIEKNTENVTQLQNGTTTLATALTNFVSSIKSTS